MDYSSVRVLVVDDEPAIRESLVGFLEDYYFVVSPAESAEEALKLLARRSHDVAIIDLRLPEMSGETLIMQVYEMFPTMRILIHTGSTSYRLSEELKRIGIQPEHVFIKPQPDLTILVEAIENLMREQGREDNDA